MQHGPAASSGSNPKAPGSAGGYLLRCSLSNLQFPAIALTWCGLTSHRHRSIEPFFMSLAARDSEFRRWSGRVDRLICQTFAASPAEPGELPLGFREVRPLRLDSNWGHSIPNGAKEINMAKDTHVTAPTRFVEANGSRYAYRRFG